MAQELTCMIFLYKKGSVQVASAEPPPRRVIGTGQLCRLRFRPGPLPVGGGGGMISFGSASTTQYSLCPAGDARLYERVVESNILSCFVVGRPRPEYGLPVAVLYERVEDSNILSCFVVGRPRPEYGLPVAVIKKWSNRWSLRCEA